MRQQLINQIDELNSTINYIAEKACGGHCKSSIEFDMNERSIFDSPIHLSEWSREQRIAEFAKDVRLTRDQVNDLYNLITMRGHLNKALTQLNKINIEL